MDGHSDLSSDPGVQSSKHARGTRVQPHQPASGWSSIVDNKDNVKKFLQSTGFGGPSTPFNTAVDNTSPVSGPLNTDPRSHSVSSSATLSVSSPITPSQMVPACSNGLKGSIHARNENQLPIDRLAQTLRSSSRGQTTPPLSATTPPQRTLPLTEMTGEQIDQSRNVPTPSANIRVSGIKLDDLKISEEALPENLSELQQSRSKNEENLRNAHARLSLLRATCDSDLKQYSEARSNQQAEITKMEKNIGELQKQKAETNGYLATAREDATKSEALIRKYEEELRTAQEFSARYQKDLSRIDETLTAVSGSLTSGKQALQDLSIKEDKQKKWSLDLTATVGVIAELTKGNPLVYDAKLKKIQQKSAVLPQATRKAGQADPQTIVAKLNELHERREASSAYAGRATVDTNMAGGSLPKIKQEYDVELELVEDVEDTPRKWPNPQGRPAGSSVKRTVFLKNLPESTEIKHIICLLFHGQIQDVKWDVEKRIARVLFLTHEGCMAYYGATANGIPYPGEPKRVIEVELGKDTDPVHGIVRGYVEGKMTRCVRATGSPRGADAEPDWSSAALNNIGKGCGTDGSKLPGVAQLRRLEGVLRGKSLGNPVIVWRFASILEAAHMFKWLRENWDEYTITYDADPCAKAKGLHFEGAKDLMEAARRDALAKAAA